MRETPDHLRKQYWGENQRSQKKITNSNERPQINYSTLII